MRAAIILDDPISGTRLFEIVDPTVSISYELDTTPEIKLTGLLANGRTWDEPMPQDAQAAIEEAKPELDPWAEQS